MIAKIEEYTLQAEAETIFQQIVHDSRLDVPGSVKDLASSVKFVGDETKPFYPVPYKCAEAQASLLGYVGLFANAISKDRYGIEQDVEIDVYGFKWCSSRKYSLMVLQWTCTYERSWSFILPIQRRMAIWQPCHDESCGTMGPR